MSTRFKTLGITDQPGHCDLCGTYCPRRRVAVELIDADGSTTGDVQLWGVVCAAEARHGRRDSTLARMLRDEAEEAGAYTGAVPARRRRAAATPRRQTRKEAERAAAQAAAEARIVWNRTACSVPADVAADPEAAAGYRYRMMGRPMEGSYLAGHDDGRTARIDGNDLADVARFERCGFRRLAEALAVA
jgi:hypothetical protein